MLIKLSLLLLIYQIISFSATIQIIVKNDNGSLNQDITFTLKPNNGTGNDILKSLQDWRDSQVTINDPPIIPFPNTIEGNKAFWKTVIVPSLQIKIDLFPWQGLVNKRNMRKSSNDKADEELRNVFK